ncbi:MAG: hypothetical protein V4478_03310 [Patescibacteria group bacterium]
MANNQQESHADDHGLQNLPQKEREETQKILDELQEGEKDNTEAPEKETEKPQKQEEAETPAKEEPKEGEEKPDSEKGEKKERRETGLVPAWKLGMEKTRAAKVEADLKADIENLKNGTLPEKKQDESKEEDVDIDAVAKAIIEKHDVQDPEVIEDIFKAIKGYVSKQSALPADLQAKLAQIDEIKAAEEIKVEEANFNRDFDKDILPLIKSEYGEDITDEKVAEIKEKLKEIAYSPEYAKVPYDEIYHGKRDFRGVVAPKKKSAEGTRESSINLKAGETNYSELTDAEAAALSPEEFQKYSDNMAKNERQSK